MFFRDDPRSTAFYNNQGAHKPTNSGERRIKAKLDVESGICPPTNLLLLPRQNVTLLQVTINSHFGLNELTNKLVKANPSSKSLTARANRTESARISVYRLGSRDP